jgi:serine/threonine protein kinase
MFYCINPGCCARNNHDNRRNCVACGTPLLIQSRYRLIHPMRHLERSRHFEVFEVSDTQGAHKILKVLKTNREELIQLFYREAEVLRWLDHPGIPSVAPDGYFPFPSEAEPRLHCLVMEKVDGINLEDWIKHHQLTSPSIVLKWMEELTQILEQIHKKNLFHRDIKPSNIICKPDGRLPSNKIYKFCTV